MTASNILFCIFMGGFFVGIPAYAAIEWAVKRTIKCFRRKQRGSKHIKTVKIRGNAA